MSIYIYIKYDHTLSTMDPNTDTASPVTRGEEEKSEAILRPLIGPSHFSGVWTVFLLMACDRRQVRYLCVPQACPSVRHWR